MQGGSKSFRRDDLPLVRYARFSRLVDFGEKRMSLTSPGTRLRSCVELPSSKLSVSLSSLLPQHTYVTHSPCISTCTTHPALPIPLPQPLYAHTTNTSGTKCKNGVKVLWCHSHLVWLVSPLLHVLLLIQTSFCDFCACHIQLTQLKQ